MDYRLLLVPLISALLGWLASRIAFNLMFHPVHPVKILGFTVQGVVPKNQKRLAEKIGKLLSKEVFSDSGFETKISDPQNIKRLLPLVDQHIDHFLRVKLAESIPAVGMFVGEKTLGQLKQVFLTELEQLFPVIMDHYLHTLKTELDLEKMLVNKLGSISSTQLETLFRAAGSKQRRWVDLYGAALGFIIGLMQVVILLFAGR